MPNIPNSPPRPKGPHLNALRAFEAAARLGSFIAAAQELNVTPGAIAQHVKSLEAWANAKLFSRNPRGVALTPLGASLLPKFEMAFDQLGDAVHALRTSAAPDNLRIATLPAIAQLWLSERLGRLRKQVPELTVSVYAFETLSNPQREPFDITLFFDDTPLEKDDLALFQDRIFPVCTPEIASQIKSITDLQSIPMLKDAAWYGDWNLWLRSLPTPANFAPKGPQFSLFSVAVEETLNSAGILIAHEALVNKHLMDGRLVAPFRHQLLLERQLVMKMTPATKLGRHFANIREVLTTDEAESRA